MLGNWHSNFMSDRRGRYGPETPKAELLLLLDGTAHQATALLEALQDVVDCYARDDGGQLAVAIAHADFVVSEAKAGRRIQMTASGQGA